MARDTFEVGSVVERKSKLDTDRSASKYGTIERLTYLYAFVKWNTGLTTRIQRVALKLYQPPQ